MTNGKENDVRIDLKNILTIVYSDCTVSFVIPDNKSWFTDADWIKKYPVAHEIYRVWGIDPNSYVTKTRIL